MYHARIIFILLIMFSCNSPDIVEAEDSFFVRDSEKSVDQLVEAFKAKIIDNDLKIFSVIDHSKAAQGVDIDLRPTTLIIFGNPAMGSQLMKCDQRMGIELPMKVLIWQGSDNRSHIGFWHMGEYAEYYELEACTDLLEKANQKIDGMVKEVL